MKDESDTNLEPSDTLLIEILDSTKSQQKVQTVLSLLQQDLATKIPDFTNLAEEEGMRLTRAAFAVMLKFTDSLAPFQDLITEVDKKMNELTAQDANLTLEQKINATIEHLNASESSKANLSSLLYQWEQASQMRRMNAKQSSQTIEESIKKVRFLHKLSLPKSFIKEPDSKRVISVLRVL